MNEGPTVSPQRGMIDLAREPDFAIGELSVCPSRRQAAVHGHQDTVQPRVMQVLVALWQAGGGVVSRDELIERCWDGVTVGDDAINRCVAKVRQLAEMNGGPHFEIATIPRVGYRLIEKTPGPAGAQVQSAHPGKSRRALLLAAAGLALVLAGAIAAWTMRPGSASVTLAVAVTGSRIPDLATGVATDLTRMSGAHGNLSFAAASGNVHGDFLLRIAARGTGSRVEADATLSKRGSADLIWTSSLPASDAAVLRQRLASAVSATVGCAIRTIGDLRRADSGSLRLLLAACDRLENRFDDPDEQTVQEWRQVVAALPRNPSALATLAFLESQAALTAPQQQADALRSAAKSHLRQALSTGGTAGMIYAAQAASLPLWQYRDRLAALDRGLALDPDCAALHVLKGQALRSTGRVEEGIQSARRAVELDPGSIAHRLDLISGLAYAGYAQTAASELEAAEKVWPDSVAVQETRFRYDLRFGNPQQLLRKIDRGVVIPNTTAGWQNSIGRSFLLARADPSPPNVAAALNTAVRYAHEDAPQTPLQNMVALGHVDDAYALLREPLMLDLLRGRGTEVLFRANMRDFRRDRRFMPLAETLGLVRYWQSGQVLPDFCSDSDNPYDCAAEFRRLHPAQPAK